MALLVVLLVFLALPAGAQARWTRLADLSPVGEVSEPSVDVDAQGAAVVAWSLDVQPGTTRVVTASRVAGGRFGAAAEIGGSEGLFPQTALSPGGEAFVAWERLVEADRTSHTRLDGSLRPPGGAFGPAAPITAPVEFDRIGKVAYDRDGRLFVAHRDGLEVRSPGGSFAHEAWPGLADFDLDRTGRMTFLVNLPGPAIGVQTRASDGTLSPARELVRFTCTDDPEEPTCAFNGSTVAAADTGRGLAVWCVPSGRYLALRYATRSPNGEFGSARYLRASRGVCAPEAEMGPAGDAIVAWVTRGRLRAILFSRAGRPGKPRELGPVISGSVQIAIAANGESVLTWLAGVDRLRAAIRHPGHAIGQASTIATDLRESHAVDIDGSGHALVVYAGGGTQADQRRLRALSWRP
ncbi:MAG: hypothetical protein QOE65_1245 [Solirubrobacteraceae bacterium]|jgi:hypothetical protein|nr:hypothetical protein [Solirubrobacteraceae bacterium]